MSEDAAQEIMDQYDKWDDQVRRRDFVARMEHKLYTKERRTSRRT